MSIVRAEATDQVKSFGRSRGFIEKSFLDEDGTRHPYLVFVPHTMQDSDKLPLMVYLNGGGENGKDGIMPLKNGLAPAVWEQQCCFPFVVVWPQCDGDDTWSRGGRSVARAIAIMRQVADEFHTDSDRVYLTGISSGGGGTWSIAATYSDLFAAIVPVSTGASGADIDRITAADLPVWSYFVDTDKSGMREVNQSTHRRLLELGLSPHLTEVQAGPAAWIDCHDAWSFGYRDGGLYRWLAAQSLFQRSKTRRRFELVSPAKFPSIVESAPPRDGARASGPEVTRTFLASPETAQPELSQLTLHGLEELHLEFRPALGTKRFSVGFFDVPREDLPVGTTLDMAVNDPNSGGLYSWPEQRCLHSSSPVAEFMTRVGAWNDLRLTFIDGRVSAELNGWSLLNGADLPLAAANAIVGFVACGNAGTHVEIQNVRIRRAGKVGGEKDVGKGASRIPEAPRLQSLRLPLSDEGAKPIEIATIGEAWKKREQSFPHLDIRWVEGAESRFVSARFRSSHGNPSAGIAAEPSRLVLSPHTARYSTVWQHPQSEFWRAFNYQDYHRDFLARFAVAAEHCVNPFRLGIRCEDDRRIDTLFEGTGQGANGTGLAIRRTVFRRPDVWCRGPAEMDDLLFRGALAAFRPLTRYGLYCRLEACRILSEMPIVAGVRCVVIEETVQEKLKRSFWTDPLRDFLILRASVTEGNVFQEQLDIEYSQDSAKQWLPTSWSAVARPIVAAATREPLFPGVDRLLAVSSARVVDCTVKDSSIDVPRESDLAPGAIVFDQAAGEWSRHIAGGQFETVKPDEVRELTEGTKLPQNDSLDRNQFSDLRNSWRIYVGIGAGLVLALKLIQIGWKVRTPR